MKRFVFSLSFMYCVIASISYAEILLDHEVILDAKDRLQPCVPYKEVVVGSMTYIKNCPTVRTRHGQDPWYLVTSKLNDDFTFRYNQNNQGSNAYYAVESLRRYLKLTNDETAIAPARLLLDRVMRYHTPKDWAWPEVPRTQDDSPDGHYTDRWSGVDKMCMVGIAYLRFFDITEERKYFDAACAIGKTVSAKVGEGSETKSPLPFRVNMKTGEVLDHYTSGIVFPVIFFEELSTRETGKHVTYRKLKEQLWEWVMTYPVKNNYWSGYYEDVNSNHDNLNQQVPLETARYMIAHYDDNPEQYQRQIPALIDWVCERFGQTKRYGATSIKEQDGCFREMSSHTARYASIVAGWWNICETVGHLDKAQRDALKEEARASLALCTYSTWSRYSTDTEALNYVGAGYLEPWFSDSYFDFLPHVIDTATLLGKL